MIVCRSCLHMRVSSSFEHTQFTSSHTPTSDPMTITHPSFEGSVHKSLSTLLDGWMEFSLLSVHIFPHRVVQEHRSLYSFVARAMTPGLRMPTILNCILFSRTVIMPNKRRKCTQLIRILPGTAFLIHSHHPIISHLAKIITSSLIEERFDASGLCWEILERPRG